MIFKTENNELAIFGNTLSDIHGKWNSFVRDYKQKRKLLGSDGALSSLFGNTKSKNVISPEVLSQFEEFKEKFNNSKLSAEVLAEEMGNVDSSIVSYAKTCKNGTLTTEGFTASLKGTSLSAKAATIATKAFSLALNTIAFVAIAQGISFLISQANKYINAASEAKESSEALAKEMRDFNSTVGENTKTVETLNDKYQELSKEVNNLGENVSLSVSEYEEYKDVIKQVSDIMPDLAARFNAQGEAIGFVDGKLKDHTGKANKAAIRNLLLDKFPDTLSPSQKERKILTLLTALKRKGVIEKDSDSKKMTNWILAQSNKTNQSDGRIG